MRAHSALSWLSVFTSGSTLVCCALPALMVAIGAGAALSGLVAAVPQLVWLSEHKVEVFSLAGALLAVSGLLQWRAPGPRLPRRSCPRRQLRDNERSLARRLVRIGRHLRDRRILRLCGRTLGPLVGGSIVA